MRTAWEGLRPHDPGLRHKDDPNRPFPLERSVFDVEVVVKVLQICEERIARVSGGHHQMSGERVSVVLMAQIWRS